MQPCAAIVASYYFSNIFRTLIVFFQKHRIQKYSVAIYIYLYIYIYIYNVVCVRPLLSVVSCTDPGLVAHSRRVLTGPQLTVGSTVQYVCSKGFTLSGNSLVTCYNHGSSGPKWNQPLPRCLRMCTSSAQPVGGGGGGRGGSHPWGGGSHP